MTGLRQISLRRVDSFVLQLERIASIDFPHPGGKEAIRKLHEAFSIIRDDLLAPEGSTVEPYEIYCQRSIQFMSECLPVMGFVVRSTDVRNSFEIYSVLDRIARPVLNVDLFGDLAPAQPTIVLSSEWEYAPYVSWQIPQLDDYVFIGFPVHESGNPLLLPLAGHELGHTVWARFSVDAVIGNLAAIHLENELRSRISEVREMFFTLLTNASTPEDVLRTLFVNKALEPVEQYYLSQIEESVCDILGIRLFGKSFVFAFAYLLSPMLGSDRVPTYPSYRDRLRRMRIVCESMNCDVDNEWFDLFDNSDEPPENTLEGFMVRIADVVCEALIPTLQTIAERIVQAANIVPPRPDTVENVVNRLRLAVPYEGDATAMEVVEAGWLLSFDETLWQDSKAILPKRSQVLSDLVLKSIEVMEVRSKWNST